MSETDHGTAQIVRAYYDTLTDGMTTFDPPRLIAIIVTDLVFEDRQLIMWSGGAVQQGNHRVHRDRAQPRTVYQL